MQKETRKRFFKFAIFAKRDFKVICHDIQANSIEAKINKILAFLYELTYVELLVSSFIHRASTNNKLRRHTNR